MNAHTLSISEVMKALNVTSKGLSSAEVKKRKERFGENKLNSVKRKNPFIMFLQQFKDFMILILIVAAAISFAVSYLRGQTDYLDPIIILSIIMLNAVLGLIQEAKAEHAIEALMKMSTGVTTVLRNNEIFQLPSVELVPGDIIMLEAGYLVPADARLISSNNIRINESALTGESQPVTKDENCVLPEKAPIADRANMLYNGCMITGGHGTAVVTSTGMNTEVGKIATLIQSASDTETPIQKHMTELGRFLGIIALGICVLLFLVGVYKGYDMFDMFMTSVSLAVAAIPEGLAAVITIMLSLGVQRMSKQNTIIRNLSSIELLGTATYICSDKTGTLTENNMTVTACSQFTSNRQITDFAINTNTSNPSLVHFISTTLLCCDSGIDPTEKAIINLAAEYDIKKADIERKNNRVDEIAFDSVRKRMTTFNTDNNSILAVSKGAAESILSICNSYTADNKIYPLTPGIRNLIITKTAEYSKKALRVIAVAYKKMPAKSMTKQEAGFTFMGLIGMIDPPRTTSAPAVATCRDAGIAPVMITGDHILTAQAIGEQIAIPGPAINGVAIDSMSDEEFLEAVHTYRIFARVSPEHKVRIVNALRSQGETVIMTGDGINDAPALKAADIGCSMGISGTDVAKSASDMILTDDNFSTIVTAIKEGRCIYDNIRNAVHFLLSCNIGEIITILVAILLGMPSPLLPVQLLWVNLITDSFPAIAIGMAPPEPGIMNRKPFPTNSSIFANSLGLYILLEGIIIGGISLIAYKFCGGTGAFCVLAMSQLFHSFNIHESYGSNKHKLNKMLVLICILSILVQIVMINTPVFANILHIEKMPAYKWAIVAALSVSPLLIVRPIKTILKKIHF